MARDNSRSRRATFGLLPEPEGRMSSFGVSAIVNVTVAGLILLLTIAQVHEAHKRVKYVTQLVFPVAQPKPVVPPPPKIRYVPPPKLNNSAPKIVMPKPIVTPPAPKMQPIKMPTPAMPKLAPARPLRVAPPPQPKVGLFKSATPTRVANNRVRPTVNTGGFGDPNGVHPNPNATRPRTITALGSFDATPGRAKGAGAARQGSVQGVQFGSGVAHGVAGGHDRGTVASAGFSSGVQGGTGGRNSHGKIVQTGFGSQQATRGKHVIQQVDPARTPIVVLYKPLPAYTAEARRLKIEGDVTLKVRFTAAGQVQILGVVRGLGHGLDQQAEIAAEHIRFKPATRDGHPVNEVSIIHVTFELA